MLDQLGIAGRSTPALRLLVSRAVCEANSVASARELLSGGGVDIDHKAALRLTYLVTEDALRARAEAMGATTEGDDAGAFAGRRVVAAIDGGRLQVRRRVAGRPKKGGRKRFVTEWREPKVLTVYVLGEDGKRDRSVPSVIDGTLGRRRRSVRASDLSSAPSWSSRGAGADPHRRRSGVDLEPGGGAA